MIICASQHVDVPALLGDWFMRRLAAGSFLVGSRHGLDTRRISLEPTQLDGFVFWTRHAAPFLSGFEMLKRLGLPFFVQFSVIGYPEVYRNSVVDVAGAVEQIRTLARRHGRDAVVWRYGPIVINGWTPAAWHERNFGRLAKALRGSSDEVTLSFADGRMNAPHRHTRHRAAARNASVDQLAGSRRLARDLASIAHDNGMAASLCCQPDLLTAGLSAARCVSARRLSQRAGHHIEAPRAGLRPDCLCAQACDIVTPIDIARPWDQVIHVRDLTRRHARACDFAQETLRRQMPRFASLADDDLPF